MPTNYIRCEVYLKVNSSSEKRFTLNINRIIGITMTIPKVPSCYLKSTIILKSLIKEQHLRYVQQYQQQSWSANKLLRVPQ